MEPIGKQQPEPAPPPVTDAKGRQLNVGDIVLIPCRVTDIEPGKHCDVCVEKIAGAVPDPQAQKNRYSSANSRQLIRANPGDDTRFQTFEDNGKLYIR